MYKNIGKKLCGLAKFFAFFGILAVIGGFVCVVWGALEGSNLIGGGLAAIVSGIASIVATWPLYAFGQLTEDVHAIRVAACDQPEPVYTLDLD